MGRHILLLILLITLLLGLGVIMIPVTTVRGQVQQHQSLGEDTVTFCPDTYVITRGPTDKKQIALTFDADMTFGMDRALHTGVVKSYIDHDLINVLINTQTKATLFLTGLWIRDYPDDTRLLGQNPLFELENHSFSHPSFSGYCYGLPQLQILTMQEEILETNNLLTSIAGVTPQYFRFPGGCVSTNAMDFLSSHGMQVVHWDSAGEDGFNQSAQSIVQNVISTVHNGSIIVLHMNGAPNDPQTSKALPQIISQLSAQGFSFVKVSELLQ